MSNKVQNISEAEFNAISKEYSQNDDVFYVCLDAAQINTLQDYFREMGKAFLFPRPAKSFAVFDDWMRDLDWIKQEEIVLVITNASQLLSRSGEGAGAVINDFETLILPFWEGDVGKYIVGGASKKFNVYLLS